MDDFEQYDLDMAQSILAGSHYCFFCGKAQPPPNERRWSANLLCKPCSERYDGSNVEHSAMCPRIVQVRQRQPKRSESHWVGPCHKCDEIKMWTRKQGVQGGRVEASEE